MEKVWRGGGGATARQNGNARSQAPRTSQTQQRVQDRGSRPGLQPPRNGRKRVWTEGGGKGSGERGWVGPTDPLALSTDCLVGPSQGGQRCVGGASLWIPPLNLQVLFLSSSWATSVPSLGKRYSPTPNKTHPSAPAKPLILPSPLPSPSTLYFSSLLHFWGRLPFLKPPGRPRPHYEPPAVENPDQDLTPSLAHS